MNEPPDTLPPTLFYFADPMCSWCWGFSPVMEAVIRSYPRLPVSLVMGGLRTGVDPLPATQRDEILHHWHAVQARTGQSFQFENALPDGFVYDTEPACRAVVSMIALQRTAAFAYLQSVQRAFYVEQRDVTSPDVLAERAQVFGVKEDDFRALFDSESVRAKTGKHFAFTRETGVRGFPTIILGDGRGFLLLSSGYQPYEELRPSIGKWLQTET